MQFFPELSNPLLHLTWHVACTTYSSTRNFFKYSWHLFRCYSAKRIQCKYQFFRPRNHLCDWYLIKTNLAWFSKIWKMKLVLRGSPEMVVKHLTISLKKFDPSSFIGPRVSTVMATKSYLCLLSEWGILRSSATDGRFHWQVWHCQCVWDCDVPGHRFTALLRDTFAYFHTFLVI